MWEYSDSPFSECSGLLYTSMVITPLASGQIDGWRGVPFFSLKHVSMCPIANLLSWPILVSAGLSVTTQYSCLAVPEQLTTSEISMLVLHRVCFILLISFLNICFMAFICCLSLDSSLLAVATLFSKVANLSISTLPECSINNP